MTQKGPVRCVECGKFIAAWALARSRNDFVPLNEFGPETSEWTCPVCLVDERVDWEKL